MSLTEREIVVETPDGKTVSVNLFLTDSVKHLKEQLKQLTELNIEQHQISLNNKILLDRMTISDLSPAGYPNVIKLTEILGK